MHDEQNAARRGRAASSTRVVQQFIHVTEGKEPNAIRIARARMMSARVPQAPRMGRWSTVTHPRSPQTRPFGRSLRTQKAGTVCR
ncbi:hypothetical protein OQI_28260 [Streptomyces pharetrae CZA14]|uniref:Uncharacterized protein n=1 Tax=Streptomyces pharetrae CZA14 TaxID=1144883 RepID=A0ABX3YDD2_9ACTN|nr:hypothetical protein OQI_28260 [Streptomyces pharetrae CZA14]